MNRKLHKGQASAEYLAILVIVTATMLASTQVTDEVGNSVLDNLVETFQNQWNGFTFMVSLPLS